MVLGNSFEPRSNSHVPNGTAGPVMITCLSINRRFCNRKTSLTRENKIDLLVVSLFLLVDQETETRKLCSQCRMGFQFLHNAVSKIGSILYIFIYVHIFKWCALGKNVKAY